MHESLKRQFGVEENNKKKKKKTKKEKKEKETEQEKEQDKEEEEKQKETEMDPIQKKKKGKKKKKKEEEKPFRIIAPEDRIFDVVKGGCMMASLMQLRKNMLIQNDEITRKVKPRGRNGWHETVYDPTKAPGMC